MAASDKHYRDQNTLDVVFAVSSILMLASLILMLIQDYNREYKVEQRVFRDVEVAIAQRAALDNLPEPAEFDEATKLVATAREERKGKQAEIGVLKKEINDRLPLRDINEVKYQAIKADLESRVSFYDIEVEHHGISDKAKRYKEEIIALEENLKEAKAQRDEALAEIRKRQMEIDEIEAPLVKATTKLKKLNDQFDSQMKTALLKTWGPGDWFRTLPILDAFASPIKIHEFTINDVPIDYNFKYVTRFDRCMTCHLGIDREAFNRENILALRGVTNEQDRQINQAIKLLKERKEALSGLPEAKQLPDPDDLKLLTLSPDRLNDARITEFCAHPRLDLFVGPTSKHPAAKFGCSSCHQGQGSSTSFVLASHTPNTSEQESEWHDKYHWEANHMWDFPMLPKRFIESSCVKCHYQITDLVSTENRIEAPKLLEGFKTIQEVGCFGCHEINGRKGGRQIGPDIRLESTPPLEDLTPGQRSRIESDPDTAPGKYRKVGPSLYRLSEKTNEEFVRKWIFSPRGFRPDTKMPHYYGLSTNSKDVLPDSQKDFPNTEVYAVTRFLFTNSKSYLKDLEERKKDTVAERLADHEYRQFLNAYLEGRSTMTQARFDELIKLARKVTWSKLLQPPVSGEKNFEEWIGQSLKEFEGRLPADLNKDVSKKLEAELRDVTVRINLRDKVPVLADQAKGLKGDAKRGRVLFSEKGCLACHIHDATVTAQGAPGDKDYSPAFVYDAEFGPSLSQVVEKLGTKAGDKASARVWLVQWLLDPTVHSPRSRMPSMHLSKQEAVDVASWLLSFPKGLDVGEEWNTIQIPQPTMKQLKDLARVYLVRILAGSDIKAMLDDGEVVSAGQISELPNEEKWLAQQFNKAAKEGPGGPAGAKERDALRESTLLEYVGRKAVNRLGCYGCHDMPGFDNAKPIGVALNDWGKKSPERLAFDDIKQYVEHHFKIVDNLVKKDGKPVVPVDEDGVTKKPYEKFYADALFHHTREGFLNQKLLDPRSYDYNRLRAWDDRSRMPQFQFTKFRLSPQVKVDQALQLALKSFLVATEKMTINRVNAFLGKLPNTPVLETLRAEVEEVVGKLAFGDLKLKKSDENFKESTEFGSVDFDKTESGREIKQALDQLYARTRALLAQVEARLPTEGEMQGQAIVQEAKAREAVATFILGLVAEPVPLTSINQPKGDRLAEIKGRQVLEKFNCVSCHLIRPGYFEFKATPQNKEYLETVHGLYLKSAASSYDFPEHYYWSGTDPKAGTVKAMVNWPSFADGKMTFPLLEALRFQGADRTLYDVGTLSNISIGGDFGIRVQDMIAPTPNHFTSTGELSAHLHKQGPFGGTFGEALTHYLMEKTKKDATPLNYNNARSSAPPYLTAQGEKTQPEWLNQFLLEPSFVRKMVVLRMPKFTLSADESRTLVEYFSAVERISNPGIGLKAPYDNIKQQGGLESAFWKEKNGEYITRLKSSFVTGPDGKASKKTWYDKRLEELKPFWERIGDDHRTQKEIAQKRLAEAQTEFEAINKEFEPKAAALKKLEEELSAKQKEAEKDKKLAGEVKDLQAKVDALRIPVNTQKAEWESKSRTFESWKTELAALNKDDDRFSVKELEKSWLEGQAYLADSFRLLFHKQLCAQCHQVGERETPASTPGPNLTLAHKRLRPGWTERWVTNPAYFLHYTPMPVNFKKGDMNYQELFVGTSFEQIQAVRDVLMVYPQVAELPLNRYWILPPSLNKGTEEKGKTGEKK